VKHLRLELLIGSRTPGCGRWATSGAETTRAAAMKANLLIWSSGDLVIGLSD
jgi:hypothetical protein